jgi:hypothetical protein
MNPAVIGLASAYLIGELVATPKRRHPIVRGLCVAAGGYVLIGVFSIRAAILVALLLGAGLILDSLEKRASSRERRDPYNDAWLWLAFRTAYMTAAVVLCRLLPIDTASSLWPSILGRDFFPAVAVFAGVIACIWLGSVFMERAIAPFADQLETAEARGLESAGKIIGQLERFLIFVFILSGSSTAVGFLVAAKSILRFGELSNEDNRRLTEYIIIGTFMSFAYAVVVSLIVRWAIDGYLNT